MYLNTKIPIVTIICQNSLCGTVIPVSNQQNLFLVVLMHYYIECSGDGWLVNDKGTVETVCTLNVRVGMIPFIRLARRMPRNYIV